MAYLCIVDSSPTLLFLKRRVGDEFVFICLLPTASHCLLPPMHYIRTLMNKKERVNFIIETLEDLYPNPAIPLDHTDAYTMLISVLLSAQCTDVRVNQVTPHLWERAKTPKQW